MKVLAIAGWIFAIIGGFAALTLFQRNQAVEQTRYKYAEEVKNLQIQVEKLEEINARHAYDAQKLAPPVAPPAQPAPPENPIPAAETMPKETAAAAPAEEPAAEGETEQPELNDDQKRMLKAQTSAVTDMVYGEFLAGLNLPSETADAVHQIIGEAMGKEMMLTQQALGSTPPWSGKKLGEQKDAIRASLRESLQQQLTPEQLTAWDQQEAMSTQILYENVVGGQLAMLAPSLGDEARRTIGSVVGEELAIQLDGMETVDDPYSRERFAQAQRTALENSVERLRDALNDEEFAQLERYRQQAEQTFQALAPGS